jgi:carbon monoxide dehydrogenase subunit G
VARDAAGNQTISAAVPVTVSNTAPPPPSPGDFQTLCGRPGVVKCVGFDSTADLTGAYGDNSGILSGDSTPQIDLTVKSSGNGSLKFTIPSNSSADSSGSYFTNFSNDLATQFAENSEFYIQWRQRFSPEFVNTVYSGGGGWKQTIIGTGDKPGCSSSNSASGLCYASCTALETVTQNTYQRGFAQMYNSCTGSTSHRPYDPFEQAFGSYDFMLQNFRPSPYCLYSQGQTNPPSYFPPNGNCFGYFPNEWMTFQVHIKTGPRLNDEFTNSYVQLSIAREGQPGQLVLDWGPYNLTAGDPASNQKFGKIWLLPYNTGKDPSATYPVAYTWYDDLIISTQPISMGSTPAADTNPPTVSLTSPANGSTVSSTITISATASDNVGVTGVQFQLDGVNLGAEDTTSPYSATWNTTTAPNGSHTLAAVARDAAGNMTTSTAVSVTVSNVLPDTTPPTVSISGLSNGSTVSSTITVSAAASDDVGVAGVQFQLDGANLGPEDTTSPYSATWNTATASNGSHTLAAVARDAAGNMTTSTAVSVTVSNVLPDTTPPTVSISGLSSGSTVSSTITVSAAASDDVGVAGVQFQLDGANLGPEDTTSPYSATWNTATASNGSHTLAAVARDAAGNMTTSTAVSVTVNNILPSPAGLIGYWAFNEGTGVSTIDSSGRNNTGTLVNGPIWTAGKVSNALRFNATDNGNDDDDPRVVIGRNFDVSTLPFTLSAWINPVDFTDWRAIFSKRDSPSRLAMRFDIGLSQGNGQVYVNGATLLTFGYAPPTNTWTHITVVATSSNTKLYVNGVLRKSIGAMKLGTKASANTVIGGTGEGPGGDNDPFKGMIDEVRVYNRALSASEVQNAYAASAP